MARLRLLFLAWLFLTLLLAAACSDESSTAPATSATTSLAASAAVSPSSPAPADAGVHCGTERWPVKTLSDPDAAGINFTPVPSSVAALRGIHAPESLPQSARVPSTEVTIFSVNAQLVEFKLEEDRDIHLVIADPADPSQTMITEFPDAADCVGAVGSSHASEMLAARQALTAVFGQPSSSHFTSISGTATIIGVGFFDF